MNLLLAFSFCISIMPTTNSNEYIVDPHGRRIILKERNLPARYDECHLCHTHKNRPFMGKKIKTSMEHEGKSAKHGSLDLACQSCHDINHFNYLISNKKFPSSFENSSGVCQRCHADRYRDWLVGAHGKRTGSWNEGSLVQYHCIDCHDAHSVEFKPMDSGPTPPQPQFLIRKHREAEKSWSPE